MRRWGAAAIAITILAAACGGNVGSQPPGPETTTTVATGNPSSLPTSTTSTTTSTTSPQSTTTTTPSSTPTTQPVVAPRTLAVAPWFFIDEEGHPARTGPFLLPVHREVPYTLGVGRAALEQLFLGPTGGEKDGLPSISSTIPADVEVRGLTIQEGIAVVDLSDEFEGTVSSPVVAQRMAQVVFTLTSIPFVTEVLFQQEGKAILAQTGDGQLVSRPVLKADYLDFAAALTVESPVYNGVGGSPLHVTGFGSVFEAAFNYTLTDDDGLIIAEGHAMTNNGTGWGAFDFIIHYDVDQTQVGALIVWTYSAADGERIDIREYPVVLKP